MQTIDPHKDEYFALFERLEKSPDELYVLRGYFLNLQDAVFYAYNRKFNFRVYKSLIENGKRKFDLRYNRDAKMTFGEI